MKPITEHPAQDTRVEIYFHQTELGIPGHRDGIWNGSEWKFRKPYTKDEYIDIPPHCQLTGWTEASDRKPYETE